VNQLDHRCQSVLQLLVRLMARGFSRETLDLAGNLIIDKNII